MSTASQKITKLAVSLVVTLFAYFAPIHKIVSVSLFLMFVDFILGVSASLKSGEKFESKKIWATILKFAGSAFALMMAFVVQDNFNVGYPLVGIISSAVGLRELVSIFENLNILTGVDFVPILRSKFPTKTDDKNG